MTALTSIGIAWLTMSLLMSLLWFVQFKKHNAGIVDVAWSFGTGVTALWFVAWAPGEPGRRLIVAILAAAWAARLGFALLKRILGEEEDGRYQMLREKWGERTQPLMFGFFQIQAFWAVLFALPMLGAASNTATLGITDWIAIVVFLVAISGESVADLQLARFRNQELNRGKVCRVGLWKWSRHPNYFFEWIHWFAYVLLALASPLAWLTWAGVTIMLLFLTKVTGIPLTESRSIKSRGDAYRQYQREVSAFFPLPPKDDQI